MDLRKGISLGALVLGSIIFTLNSCGGGGGGSGVSAGGDIPATPSNYGKVAVFITDDISNQFDEAWVRIYRITITDAKGTVHELFSDPNGKVVNLFELSDVVELLNIATLPPGTYSNIQVELDRSVVLINKSGNPINANLSSSTLQVNGSLNLQAGAATSIGIDFDLKQFSYDPTTNSVQPVAIFKPENEIEKAKEHKAKDEGKVVSVIDATTVEVRLENGSTVRVNLAQGAAIYSKGKVFADANALSPGTEVYISGTFNPDDNTITATSMYADARPDDTPADNNTPGNSPPSGGGNTPAQNKVVEVEGRIVSINGNRIVVDVSEAEGFVPGTETITIDISNAKFVKGASDNLQVGAKIEIYGSLGQNGVVAVAVEVEGGKPNYDEGHNENSNRNENANGNHNGNDNHNGNMNDNENMNGNHNRNANPARNENAGHRNDNVNHNG